MSYFYVLKTGVRQGGVLSPFLFSIFIDDLVKLVTLDTMYAVFLCVYTYL